VNDDQIHALRSAAIDGEDWTLGELCDVALDPSGTLYMRHPEHGHVTPSKARRLLVGVVAPPRSRNVASVTPTSTPCERHPGVMLRQVKNFGEPPWLICADCYEDATEGDRGDNDDTDDGEGRR